MKYNRDIYITEHACEKFLDRFNLVKGGGNKEDAMKAAETFLKEIFSKASYVSDDTDGILFRNKEFDCDMIVQHRRLITCFHKSTQRERRMDASADIADKKREPNGNSLKLRDAHIPPALRKDRRP